MDITGLGSESVVMTSCDSLSVYARAKMQRGYLPKRLGKCEEDRAVHTHTDTLQHKRNL